MYSQVPFYALTAWHIYGLGWRIQFGVKWSDITFRLGLQGVSG
jgi:hypothetical protein